MPNITAGNVVTDSAQILPGIIVNSDINASAAIDYSKLALALSIVNADISATAAIADTKLAQIATASKVSGAAITLLSNIPAGAGVIPIANIPAAATSNSNGFFTKADSDANGATNVIAHGLSGTPAKVRITAVRFSTNSSHHSSGVKDASGQNCIYGQTSLSAGRYDSSTTGAVMLEQSAGNNQLGVVTVDGTNITITWTKTGTPSEGDYRVMWEANL